MPNGIFFSMTIIQSMSRLEQSLRTRSRMHLVHLACRRSECRHPQIKGPVPDTDWLQILIIVCKPREISESIQTCKKTGEPTG